MTASTCKVRKNSILKAGDIVIVTAGGNGTERPLKGKTGKIKEFVGAKKNRAIVEGLNFFSHHRRAQGPSRPGGKIAIEGGIAVSNLMYFVEKLKKPVKLRVQARADGKKVRGYVDPESKSFVEI